MTLILDENFNKLLFNIIADNIGRRFEDSFKVFGYTFIKNNTLNYEFDIIPLLFKKDSSLWVNKLLFCHSFKKPEFKPFTKGILIFDKQQYIFWQSTNMQCNTDWEEIDSKIAKEILKKREFDIYSGI